MKINEIIKSIRAKLFEIYPDFEYPLDFMPQQMARPSVFIEFVKTVSQKRMCKGVIMKTEAYQLTYFAPTDAYYRPDRLGLYDVLNDILELFSDEYICVGNRAVKAVAVPGGVNEREAFIDLTIEYTEHTTEKQKEIIAERDGMRAKNIIMNGGSGVEFTKN